MNELEEQAKRLLRTLLSVPFESCALITREFRDLPLSPGLYAVKHREHGLLYIGKAKNSESDLEVDTKPAPGHGWMIRTIETLRLRSHRSQWLMF